MQHQRGQTGLGSIFLKSGSSLQTGGLPDGCSGSMALRLGPFAFDATVVAIGARATPLATEVAPTPLPLIAGRELDGAETFLFHLS